MPFGVARSIHSNGVSSRSQLRVRARKDLRPGLDRLQVQVEVEAVTGVVRSEVFVEVQLRNVVSKSCPVMRNTLPQVKSLDLPNRRCSSSQPYSSQRNCIPSHFR